MQNSKLRPSPPHSVETSIEGRPAEAELGHLDVPLSGRQVLVEHADAQLGLPAHLVADRSPASRDGRRRPGSSRPGRASSGACRASQRDPRVGASHARGPARAGPSRPGRAAPPARRRRPARAGSGGPSRGGRRRAARAAPRTTDSSRGIGPPVLVIRQVHRKRLARRQAADVGSPGGAGAGRQRVAAIRGALSNCVLVRELLGSQQLQQPEEAVGVVLQRRGREQQRVAAQRGDRARRRGRPGRRGAPAAGAGGAPRRRSAGRSRPRPPARSAGGFRAASPARSPPAGGRRTG